METLTTTKLKTGRTATTKSTRPNKPTADYPTTTKHSRFTNGNYQKHQRPPSTSTTNSPTGLPRHKHQPTTLPPGTKIQPRTYPRN